MPLPHNATTAAEIEPYITAPHSKSLADFLSVFATFEPFLTDSLVAVEMLAEAFVRQQGINGVIYSEARFAPHLLVSAAPPAGVNYSTVVSAALRGLARGSEHNTSATAILCCFRGLPIETCDQVVDLAREHGAAIDLAGDEAKYPAAAWVPSFRRAHAFGVQATVHAGEACPTPELCAANCEAAEAMQVSRIGHGYHCPMATLERLSRQGVHVEACPSSSVGTGAVKSWVDHPITQYRNHKLNFGLNTDDGGVLLTNMTHEFQVSEEKLGFVYTDLRMATIQAARAAFLPAAGRAALEAKINARWPADAVLV